MNLEEIRVPATSENIRERLTEIGLWDKNTDKPIFGWTPVIQGWCIAVFDVAENEKALFVNGLIWSRDIPKSEYASRAKYFR